MIYLRGDFMNYIPFLDLESKVAETLKKEEQEDDLKGETKNA